jgi:hypothetical protein
LVGRCSLSKDEEFSETRGGALDESRLREIALSPAGRREFGATHVLTAE